MPATDYPCCRPGIVSYDIDMDGGSKRLFIPETVVEVFNEKFDYRRMANHKVLTDLAVALFTGMMSVQMAPSVVGGGDSNDLPWG